MEVTNQLQLYSISAAARVLHIGKDTMYKLVADGKIGFIAIGRRKKIPYQELVRFQNETITRTPITPTGPSMSRKEIDDFLHKGKGHKRSLNGHEILKSIMR
jgi:excisionase family DNA binding protein